MRLFAMGIDAHEAFSVAAVASALRINRILSSSLTTSHGSS